MKEKVKMELLGPNLGTPGCLRPNCPPPEIDPLDVYQKILATLHAFRIISLVKMVREVAHRRGDCAAKLTRYFLVKWPVGDKGVYEVALSMSFPNLPDALAKSDLLTTVGRF